MASWNDVANVWKNVREFDLRPIREEAERQVTFAFVGAQGVGKHTLANQFRTDPARPGATTQTPIAILELDEADRAPDADLIILIVDVNASDFTGEQNLSSEWAEAGAQILIFNNKLDLAHETHDVNRFVDWSAARALYGSALNRAFLETEFVGAVITLLPDRRLSLGRHFPLFRMRTARALIDEMSNANAIYSFTTGLAETVPALDVPLNIGDMIVLTKAQALLVYKLGLLLGLSTDWQAHLGEFGGVIGGGFLWRQLARQLVGLIPLWGIIPKVAVAYAGTYVVGHTILRWYLTGRKISGEQMRELYEQALVQGREMARNLVQRTARSTLPTRRKRAEIPSGTQTNEGDN